MGIAGRDPAGKLVWKLSAPVSAATQREHFMVNSSLSGQNEYAPSSASGAGLAAESPKGGRVVANRSHDFLYAVSTCLGQPVSLEQQFEGFFDLLFEHVKIRAAGVWLSDEDGNTRLVASRGFAPEIVERDRAMPTERCACGWAASDANMRVHTGTEACSALIGKTMLDADRAEFRAIPVRHRDRTLGVCCLILEAPRDVKGADTHDYLLEIGRLLGMAVERSRLEADARRLAIMEERNIIGNELHDSLAQSLFGMRLQLKVLSESLARKDLGAAQSEAKRLLRAMTQAKADLRDLLVNYRLKIDESGLAQSVAKLVERFARETGIAMFFQNECRSLALSATQQIQVFYIIQEALANIRKHSGARNVRIMLNNEDDLYTVLIEDDGLGMDGLVEGIPGEHAGLAIMRERTKRLPGQIVIESEPGEGTRIVLIFNSPPAPAAGEAIAAAQ